LSVEHRSESDGPYHLTLEYMFSPEFLFQIFKVFF